MISPRPRSLYRVALRVTDLDIAISFYRDVWGMCVEGSSNGIAQMRSPGTDHVDLILVAGSNPGLDRLGLAVRCKQDLAVLIQKASVAGATLIRDLAPDSIGGGSSALLSDVEGNHVELIMPPGDATFATVEDPAIGPRKLGHIVLWSSNRPSLEKFYGALGFQVSDRTAIGMSFLRCNRDHHSLALVTGVRTGLQHLAFEVASIDRIMSARARLGNANVECIWGVGRHGPGNNIFSYYTDPAGNVIELYSDLEHVDDTEAEIEAKYWDERHKGDIWGVAGPPPSVFRS